MFHILFVCTHNRCRSILCEAITDAHAKGALKVSSAGSHPAGAIYPETLRHLAQHGYSIEGLQSTGWEAFRAVATEFGGHRLRQCRRRGLSTVAR